MLDRLTGMLADNAAELLFVAAILLLLLFGALRLSHGLGGGGRRPRARAGLPTVRPLVRGAFKTVMLVIAALLAAGAIFAWRASVPGNGLLLGSAILGLAAVFAFASVVALDRQQREAETWRGIIDDAARLANVSASTEAPEVYRLDERGITRAERLAARGASADEICEAADPHYRGWDEPHRAAYRALMEQLLATRRG